MLDPILKTILMAGSDNHLFFGGAFTGGVHVQQDPDELREFFSAVKVNNPSYLEIGAAAGGLTYLVHQILAPKFLAIIDDNKHPKHGLRPDILGNIGRSEFHGDSHSPECEGWLTKLNEKFDLVFIDGDHTTPGVLSDVDLVMPYLADGANVVFHDANSTGVEAALQALPPELKHLTTTNGKFGIAIYKKEPACSTSPLETAPSQSSTKAKTKPQKAKSSPSKPLPSAVK